MSDPAPPTGQPDAAGQPTWAVQAGYELSGWIGRGAFGEVYRARQSSSGRPVALKLIQPPQEVYAALRAHSFRAEQSRLTSLVHPNIVPLYEVGEQPGLFYLAMGLAEGGTLCERLRREGPPALPEAVKLVEALSQAVQQAHELGIVHGDLKPSAILFDAPATPRISDFSLTWVFEEMVDPALRAASFWGARGTRSYVAPERWARSQPIGPATDVYGLGAILLELLGRRPAVWGGPEAHFRTDGLAPELVAICSRCLAADPAR